MKTGGGCEDKINDSINPDVEELIRKPHIVEWSNFHDSDSVVIDNPPFHNKLTIQQLLNQQ